MRRVRDARFRLFMLALVAMIAVVIVVRLAVVQQPSSAGSSADGTSASPAPVGSATPQATGPENVYAAIGAGRLSPAVAGVPERVYVPCGEAGIVQVIDPTTYKIIASYKVGVYPEHVTPSWDLRWLYVDVAASSRLAVIDPRTGRLTGTTFSVPHPYNLYFTPDGSKAISVYEITNSLDFHDPHTFRLLKRLPIPGRGPDHLDFTADGRFLLITTEFDGNVFKVDTRTMTVVGKINIGGLPVDVKLSPDGKVFYVANQGRSGVFVIDPVGMRLVKFIPTGDGAHGMAISRDTKLLYLSNRLAGTISVISFAGQRVIHTWKVGGSPDMLQVSPDGSELWVSNRYDASVTVLSTVTGKVLHLIHTGVDPHGLAYFPQPGRYSLGHNGVYR